MSDKDLKFNYGDAVRITGDAQAKFHPREPGSICGYRTIETEDQALTSGFSIQTVLFLVEFGSGFTIEIPEVFLERLGNE